MGQTKRTERPSCCPSPTRTGEDAQDRSEVERIQKFAAELVRATRVYLEPMYSPMQV